MSSLPAINHQTYSSIRHKKYILSLLIFLIVSLQLRGQSATWLHPNTQIGLFAADTISIFGDMINEGNILSPTGTVINFYGLRWKNGAQAIIRDESTDGFSAAGGLFRFMQTRSSSLQYISGGFSAAMNTGPSFPNLSVENIPGIALEDFSDLKVVNMLDLRRGHVFLHGWNLIMGQHTPGDIRNYSPRNFIVTGGGFLYRNNISINDQKVVFPVGTKPESFTPAAAENRGATASIRIGVKDSVYQQLTTGPNLYLTSVNKTWQMDVSQPDATIALSLVHGLSDEGPVFEANRNTSYLARFIDTGWDVAARRSAPVSPSIFTTGVPDNQAAYGTRLFQHLHTSNYFTSLVAETVNSPGKTTLQFFEAFRKAVGNDSVVLQWITGREYFCAGFTIERKYAGSSNFDSIGFVRSSAPGGISFFPTGYRITDYQPQDRFIFYRLKVQMTDGTFFYSPIRLVRGKYSEDIITVWPNPVQGRVIHIYYGAAMHVKAISLIDVPGRRIQSQQYLQPMQTRNYYEMNIPAGLASGTYFLQFIGEDNQILYVVKIVLAE
ncbi:T9SS type A sorting domain-containing protein [Chitinophaga solisilvae]|uniref:T9SS type A sorting domain-containing protein n=1 Tax=Chitinophaga solisilvae TaxID=1233460 RepID=UPI00136E03F0|nr:T9SS type A sorting domain-containing protein [Chitinophaga solisilvae]